MRGYFIMTVDVDGWPSLLDYYSVEHDSSRESDQPNVECGIRRLSQLFEKHDISCTFFVTGEMAQKYPKAVRHLSRSGHEIACHGLKHEKNEFTTKRAGQESSIRKATEMIEGITQERPRGFRAPCLRTDGNTLSVLKERGYVYDSSVIPTYIPGYYGHLTAPRRPYSVSTGVEVKNETAEILEIPISVNPLIPLPLSAAWMRNLGLSWVKIGIRMNLSLGNPIVFYVHPRDVISLPRRKGVPWHVYRNVGGRSIEMLDRILEYARSSGAEFVNAIYFAQNIHSQGCLR